ncbi:MULTISPECIES: hypothetical protein [unclassified Bradyrhizobium]|nr:MULTISPECIES: hypothetical protein [unclassified Bradyrhizobium]
MSAFPEEIAPRAVLINTNSSAATTAMMDDARSGYDRRWAGLLARLGV